MIPAQPEFEPVAVFESFNGSNSRWDFSFTNPCEVVEAHTFAEVLKALQLVERETGSGRWAVVLLSYEAAPAFDPSFAAQTLTEFPLAWVAIFDQPIARPSQPPSLEYQVSPFEPQISRKDFAKAIQQIRRYIEGGDTYQVNYTFPLKAKFSGDPFSWYRDLGTKQEAGFCAYLNLGRYKTLCLSPELFFEREGARLVTRPMKGTMARGRWLEEDERQRQKLAASSKNRAENVMIVDLLRSDLGKISEPGSIEVTRLFEVETYRTILQMTSTIEAVCKPFVGLVDLLQALFPCGSITGAPKIRTTEIIKELEPFARRAYTGSLGIVRPGGNCVFNVAIRTIVLNSQTGEATFNVGGGITYDSTWEEEYEECLLKADFLFQRWPEFELFETLLLEDGTIFLLERHLHRLKSSANYFDFGFNELEALSTLQKVTTEYQTGRWKLRLFLNRQALLKVNVEAVGLLNEKPLRVKFAAHPVHQNDIFLFHKTTNRKVYEQARKRASDCDDVIMWNEGGEVTESALANVVIREAGEYWTPSRTCGLLNGTFKEELMATGQVRERVILKEELRRCDAVFLINSVRRWMPVTLVE